LKLSAWNQFTESPQRLVPLPVYSNVSNFLGTANHATATAMAVMIGRLIQQSFDEFSRGVRFMVLPFVKLRSTISAHLPPVDPALCRV